MRRPFNFFCVLFNILEITLQILQKRAKSAQNVYCNSFKDLFILPFVVCFFDLFYFCFSLFDFFYVFRVYQFPVRFCVIFISCFLLCVFVLIFSTFIYSFWSITSLCLGFMNFQRDPFIYFFIFCLCFCMFVLFFLLPVFLYVSLFLFCV